MVKNRHEDEDFWGQLLAGGVFLFVFGHDCSFGYINQTGQWKLVTQHLESRCTSARSIRLKTLSKIQ